MFSVSFHSRLFFSPKLGGLVYDDKFDEWEDSAKFNTREVYKNLDPSAQEPWIQHGSLKRPRANHATVMMADQVFHIAGYAKGIKTVLHNRTLIFQTTLFHRRT